MTSKERVQIALAHEEPDRVPLDLWTFHEVNKALLQATGKNDINDAFVSLGHDVLMSTIGINSGLWSLEDGYIDPWGIQYKMVPHAEGKGKYMEFDKHPLAGDVSKLNSYKAPDPDSPEQYEEISGIIKKYGNTHSIIGCLVGSVFEGPWYLRGMEQFLQDLILNKDYVHQLCDIVMEFHRKAQLNLVKMGCDIICHGDDVGGQNNMFISPDIWREFVKPRYGILFQECKEINPEVRIALHCDGQIEPILDDLVEVGVEILNPIQPLSMDPGRLKQRYGTKLSFWGGVDNQEVIPFGTSEEVEKEVQLRLRQLAPGGGYIINASHRVQSTTSMDNVWAYYEAVRKHGSY